MTSTVAAVACALLVAPLAFAGPGTTTACAPGDIACATLVDEDTGGTCEPSATWHDERHGVRVDAEPTDDGSATAGAELWCRSWETSDYSKEITSMSAGAEAELPAGTQAGASARWSGTETDHGFFSSSSCTTGAGASAEAAGEDARSNTYASCPFGRPPATLFDLLP